MLSPQIKYAQSARIFWILMYKNLKPRIRTKNLSYSNQKSALVLLTCQRYKGGAASVYCEKLNNAISTGVCIDSYDNCVAFPFDHAKNENPFRNPPRRAGAPPR